MLLLGIFWLSTLIFGGTLGYIIIEGANPFDALYMTVITITTLKPNVMDFMEIASPELQMDLQIKAKSENKPTPLSLQ